MQCSFTVAVLHSQSKVLSIYTMVLPTQTQNRRCWEGDGALDPSKSHRVAASSIFSSFHTISSVTGYPQHLSNVTR